MNDMPQIRSGTSVGQGLPPDAAAEVFIPIHERTTRQTKARIEKSSREGKEQRQLLPTREEGICRRVWIYVSAPLCIAGGAILAAVPVDTRALGQPPWALAGVETALCAWLGSYGKISVQAFIIVLYLYPLLAIPLYQRPRDEGYRNRGLAASLLMGLAVGLMGVLIGGDTVGSAARVIPLAVSIGLSATALSAP